MKPGILVLTVERYLTSVSYRLFWNVVCLPFGQIKAKLNVFEWTYNIDYLSEM